MQHLISYDLARGLHIIAVIAWVSGMLMLPRFYASITALPADDRANDALLRSVQQIHTLILVPSMLLAWSFGIFLFFAYFASDWDAPLERLASVPAWFWAKLGLVLGLSAYHGMLVLAGRRLVAGERRHTEAFWRTMSVLPFFVAVVIVLLATLEPVSSNLARLLSSS